MFTRIPSSLDKGGESDGNMEIHETENRRTNAEGQSNACPFERARACARGWDNQLHGQGREVFSQGWHSQASEEVKDMASKTEQNRLKKQMPYIHTQRLKAFAKGKYEGKPLPAFVVAQAKVELKRRGISLKPRAPAPKKSMYDLW